MDKTTVARDVNFLLLFTDSLLISSSYEYYTAI